MVYFSGHCACLCVRDAGIMGTSLETLFQRERNAFGCFGKTQASGDIVPALVQCFWVVWEDLG
jgi:hypothetical protein